MPIGGQFSARSPSEVRTFSFDLVNDLNAGDSIVSATTTLTSLHDPNAAALLVGAPQILIGEGGAATVVSQRIGGFLPAVTYAWTITATAAGGDTPIIWTVYIPVGSV